MTVPGGSPMMGDNDDDVRRAIERKNNAETPQLPSVTTMNKQRNIDCRNIAKKDILVGPGMKIKHSLSEIRLKINSTTLKLP